MTKIEFIRAGYFVQECRKCGQPVIAVRDGVRLDISSPCYTMGTSTTGARPIAARRPDAFVDHDSICGEEP